MIFRGPDRPDFRPHVGQVRHRRVFAYVPALVGDGCSSARYWVWLEEFNVTEEFMDLPDFDGDGRGQQWIEIGRYR